MKKLAQLIACLLLLGAATDLFAQSVAVRSIYITEGGFVMGRPADPSSTDYNSFTHAGGDRLRTGHPVNDDLLMGSFQGSAGFDSNNQAVRQAGIAGFAFAAFGFVSAYTVDYNNNTGTPIPGVYAAPTGTIDTTTGALSLNLESWTAGWGGAEFNQGNSGVTATSSHTGANGGWDVTLNWSSLIVGGPFNGQTGYWRVVGEIFTNDCQEDSDCDDGDLCTIDTCVVGSGCVNTPLECAPGEVCVDGACVNLCEGVVCDDGNPCTDDSCNPFTGLCHSAPLGCPVGEVCVDGACVNLCTGVFCDDDGNPCTDETCNSATGLCVTTNNSDPCDDGNLCTTGDICSSGACAGTPVSCPSDGNICTDEACSPATGLCETTNNTASCSDGDACTDGDTCLDGACTAGPPAVCDDGDVCTADSCDSAIGCIFEPAVVCPEGEMCIDGGCVPGNIRSIYITGGGFTMGEPADPAGTAYNPFTHASGDRFVTGHPLNDDLLMGGYQGSPGFDSSHQASRTTGIAGFLFGAFGPVAAYTIPDNRNDPNSVVSGLYSAPTGAIHTVTGAVVLNLESWTGGWNGAEFNQGNSGVTATATPTGVNGGWDVILNWSSPIVGGPFNGQTGYWRVEGEIFPNDPCLDATECDDGDFCTTDTCLGTFGCRNVPIECPAGDVCVNGACVNLCEGVVCDDGNPCTDDSCNPFTGLCHSTPLGCPVGEVCVDGACVNLCTGVFCDDDGNPCTDETCNPATGLCETTNNTDPCNDGNACTANDTCWQGACSGSEGECPDDGNPCTDETCNPATGICESTNNNGPCEDGDPCTAGDTCAEGACVSGGPNDCDDGDLCTTDSCDPSGGCVHEVQACPVGQICVNGTCGPGNLRSIYITGGGFTMGEPAHPAGTAYNPFTHVSGDRLVTGHPLNDDILMGSFQGSPGFDLSNQALRTTGIVGFIFGAFGPVAAYTIPDYLNDTNNPSFGIYRPPTGNLDPVTGALVLDLESWTAGWNGAEFNQGNPRITSTAAPGGANGGWDVILDWSSLIVGGPFNGQTGYWRVEGEAFVSSCIQDSDCDDGDLCTTDSCDTLSGTCAFVPLECTGTDVCVDGLCVDPCTGVDCDDGDPCTVDSCDPVAGCIYEPLACAGSEFCIDGQCLPDNVEGIYITGGGFSMDEPINPSSTMYNSFTHVSGDELASGHPLNLDILMGSFQGSPNFVNFQADKTTGIVGFDFLWFGPIAGYTDINNLQYNDPVGTNEPPAGYLDTNTGALIVNLESWTKGWNGGEWNQGAGNVTASATPTGANGGWDVVLDWSSLIVNGPFNGLTGYWRIEGEVFGRSCTGDLDEDNDVDIFDMFIVANDFGKSSGFDPRADSNGDGTVDISDLFAVASNFGGGCP